MTEALKVLKDGPEEPFEKMAKAGSIGILACVMPCSPIILFSHS